jgi:hypothetical protein
MAIREIKPKENLWEYILLFVGVPKIGKTKLASLFPKSVFFFTEVGNSDQAITAWTPDTWPEGKPYVITNSVDYDKAYLELEDMPIDRRPQTAVFDTAEGFCNSIEESILDEYRNSDGKREPTIYDGRFSYGKGTKMIAMRTHEILSNFQKLGMGLIFISHIEEKERTKPDGKTEIVTRSTIPSKAKPIIHGLVDMIWFFQKEGKQRWIYTTGDTTIEAGSRINLPSRISMGASPQEAYDNIIKAFYGRDKTNGSKPDEAKAKAELMDKIQKGEMYLTSQKVYFDRAELLGIADIEKANIKNLNEYLNQLRALVPAKQ